MARPRTSFTDAELRGILLMAAAVQARFPNHNGEFLDAFITGVVDWTGRFHGQPTYVRLLDAAGITRRPSAQTWSAAILRVRDRLPLPTRRELPAATPLQAEESRVAERFTPLPRLFEPDAGAAAEWKVRTQVAEASSRDAYRQLQRMEAQRDEALRNLAMADARARESERRLHEANAEREVIAATLMGRVDALKSAEARLTGLERHLTLQTDQMRTELSQQVGHLKSRLETAEKALDRERTQVDALRRALANR